ncbi:MAG: PD-(D/E)XK nuclease family protein [Acidobacteria bacterium]|nr:PD-(D/E)XK nuclease family protein [Acidobacteriota bacterium]
MLRAFQSASAAERLLRAREFIEGLPSSSEIVIVGSSRNSADDFVRSIAENSAATLGLHRFSSVQLASQIARGEIARRGLAPLTSTGALAVAMRCIFQVQNHGAFKFFGPVANKPGFALAVEATLRELRASAIEPAELAALGDRGQDVAALFAEYLDQLHAGKLADIVDVVEIAAAEVDRDSAALARHPALLLDVPITSKAEEHFLAALASRSPAVFLTVIAEDPRSTTVIGKLATEFKVQSARWDTSLDRLQHYVFGSTPASSYPEDERVDFFSAPGEGRESIEIARRIQEAARGGVRFDQIAIALRSPETYASLLEAALERGGIAAYFARGTRRPDPSGRALIALLLCAEEGLSAKRFAEYLSLGQVPEAGVGGAPPAARDLWVAASDDMVSGNNQGAEIAAAEPPPAQVAQGEPVIAGTLRAPWKWEELLIEAAVVGGRERWQRRLNGLDAEIRQKIAALNLDEPDSAQIARLQRQLENLAHLKRFALPILRILDGFPGQATWGEWLLRLEQLATIVLRRPEHVLAILSELQPIASVGPVTLTEVREALSDRLTQLSVEPPLNRYGRVFIGTPDQLRGRAFSIVFLPGLAERIFPQRLREDPLLLDRDRRRLSRADRRLLTTGERGAEERFRLRIVAGAAKEKLYFSYPRVEVALARHRVPSFYALDVRRTTLGKLPNVEEFELSAAKRSGAGLAWLAPEKPAAAIDDIEYDLSVLRPLVLAADPVLVRGGARYLMELSADLGRSLRSRWQRWQKKWGASDGLCEPTGLPGELLAPYRLAARPYSPTSLQSFAACPYKFLLSAIHRLSAREESVPLETLDPLTRGHMYHTVVARFLREAVVRRMLPVSNSSFERAQAMLDDTLAATAAEYEEQLAPAIQRVWEEDVEVLRADLRGWLGHMAEHPDGYRPELIEFAFGLPADSARDPASTPEAARLPEGFLLHGIIDLAESNAQDERRVTDHKTGKNRTQEGMVVSGGEVLQPLLYSLAIEALRNVPVKEARLSFCSATGGYTERTVALDNPSRQLALNVLRTIDEAIGEGFLPAAPKPGACRWCDFFPLCGPHEEIRVARKDQKRLERVLNIRGMP